MLNSAMSGAENVPNLNLSEEFNSLIKTRPFYFFKTSFAVKLSDISLGIVPLELSSREFTVSHHDSFTVFILCWRFASYQETMFYSLM